jgi:hypothetical protein
MYGGDDGARTRDLCRDSQPERIKNNDFLIELSKLEFECIAFCENREQ